MAQNKDKENSHVAVEKSDVALREERILAYWKESNIFKKSLDKNKDKEEFVFYDGPPFATGTPHYGHLIPGTVKDVIPRYKTMRGKYVPRRWGWDCHGLPVENLVEKELNLSSKKDIENLGIDTFNKAARASVFRYVDEWKRIIPRTGRFVDMESAYTTMDPSYTESVWWSFKKMHDKGLVYEGFKSMHLCPRCETTLSNFEVNQGYKDITDISVYVKFELKDQKNTYLVAWTTTPWTLPGNVALAVNPKVTYVVIEHVHGEKKERLILAKDRLEKVKEKLEGEWSVVEEIEGEKLVGKSYVPAFNYYVDSVELKNKENAWKVYAGDFVTIVDGTGVVHIAPAFGNDDYELSLKEHLPFIQHVTLGGLFKDEVSDLAGTPVKPKDDHQKADIEIIKNLAAKGLLFAKEKIVHSYPHCWRCETPLLNYATSSWFIKVTSIKDQLIEENQKIQWLPETIRDGRFGKWLEGAKDWAVSRSRFWGAPIPVWKCADCKKEKVVGSIKELKNSQKEKNTIFVMRHGQSENNEKNIVSSDVNNNPSLTREGIEQVNESAKKLEGEKIDLVFSSPFNRAKETAEIVREAIGLPKDALIVDDSLREINAGIYNGRPVEEYHGFFETIHDRFIKCPPEGETYTDLKNRITRFVHLLNEKYSGKRILIVSHDSPLWLLTAGIEALGEVESLVLRGESKFFFNNAEFRKLSAVSLPHNENNELDLHRPYIDKVVLTCECGGEMNRVPEVLDTWYDSGSVPFASVHYPFLHTDEFVPKGIPFLKKTHGFPADFIAEGQDQTRGWFYTMLVLGTALFGKAPYKKVVVNGLLLAEDGRKMSKKLKNYPELDHVINKYGADALRYYLMSSPVVHAEDVKFSEKGVDEVYKKNILRLDNVVSFYEMYKGSNETKYKVSKDPLDNWIIARLHETNAEITNALENYQIDRGAWPIEKFIDDLSTWYLRRSRDRLKGDDENHRENALSTLRFVLLQFSKIIAPYIPFTADDVYHRVNGELESVHLEEWPEEQVVDKDSIATMNTVRNIVSLALEARSKAAIKVRQPLAKLTIKTKGLGEELHALIKDEVNVKIVVEDERIGNEVDLDTVLTEELREEGKYRELLRGIQEMRKKENLVPSDRVVLAVYTREEGKMLIEQFRNEVLKAAGLSDIEYREMSNEEGELVKVEGVDFRLNVLK